MNERELAARIAEAWLDGNMSALVQMVPGDPDCDACVLARSYLRALEKISRMTALLRPAQDIGELSDEWSVMSHYTESLEE